MLGSVQSSGILQGLFRSVIGHFVKLIAGEIDMCLLN